MTMNELNKEICGILAMAKDVNGYHTKELALAAGVSPSTISNKKSQKELPLLTYWSVAAIAELAGYKVVFQRKDRA